MTRRRILEGHRSSLNEIRNIMNSMKTLAYMETRKLARCLDAQHAVVKNIENVAWDFISYHPEILPESIKTRSIYITIGTERGFCGDFNHVLLKHLELALQDDSSKSPLLIAVGRKLSTLLEGNASVTAFINGASVVEEVTSLLNQLVNELISLQGKLGVLTVYCLYHGSDNGIVMKKLLPPFQTLLHLPKRFPHRPVLNQSPTEFLVSLIDYHLFAVLHEILYTSLMVENHRRVSHLEGAVKHLDEESIELSRKCNALRQEEIIEEIEVILLSASGLGDKP